MTRSRARCSTSCGSARSRGSAFLPRPLLRHGRCDAALPGAAVRARGLDGRPRAVPRAARARGGDARLDRAPARDGRLLEYARRADGLRNQGWKDSEDGVRRRGRHPARAADRPDRAAGLCRAGQARAGGAVRARRRRGARGAAAGGGGRAGRAAGAVLARRAAGSTRWRSTARGPCRARSPPTRATSSGPACWATSARQAVRDAVMAGAMFSGWGIRTLGEGEGGYNPVGYHLGSVWPHDTALIAAGLRRHGFDGDFDRVFAGLLDAAAAASDRRLAELFAGYARVGSSRPSPTRSLASRRPGRPARSRTCSRAASAWWPRGSSAGSASSGRPCRGSSTGSSCAGCGWPAPPPTCASSAGPDGAVALADARVDGDLRVVTG